MDLRDFIRPQLLLTLRAENRSGAIRAMANAIARESCSNQASALEKAVLHREKLLSTGIGLGISVPHARLEMCEDFYVALGIAKHGIDWNAIDNEPVRLIAMVVGPQDRQRDYLQLLSQLTLFLRDDTNRKRLLAAECSSELASVLEQSLFSSALV